MPSPPFLHRSEPSSKSAPSSSGGARCRRTPHDLRARRSPISAFHLSHRSMASIMAGSATAVAARPLQLRRSQSAFMVSGLKSVSFSSQKKSFSSIRLQPSSSRFRVSCAAKPETLERVCEIVKKQLALPDDSAVSGDSKFSALGADSLDTVEIVMGLEEAFGISVEEESAQSIATVQDAADLIEKLVEGKSA